MPMFLLLLFLVTSTTAFAQTPAADVQESIVVVGGEGVIRAAPDRAWISVGVESRALNAKDAQRRNAEVMTPVLADLRAAGIPEDAVRTTGYDVQPEWDYVDNRRVSRGYVARNTVEVRVDDIVRVGELLEIAVGSGATTLGGIRFDLKDRAQLERDALRRAVSDARGKAEAMAADIGRDISRIIRIEEQGVSSIDPPRPMFREAQIMSADAPPIEVGQIEVRANVTLTAATR